MEPSRYSEKYPVYLVYAKAPTQHPAAHAGICYYSRIKISKSTMLSDS